MYRSLFVAALAALAVSSFAQESNPAGIAVRAGLFFPSSSSSKDLGTTWFGGGATMRLKQADYNVGTPGSSELGISADYYGKSNASAIPVLLNFTSHNNDTYYVVGAGMSFNRIPSSSGGTDSTARFSYTFGFGYNFMQGRSPLFMEFRYWGNQNTELNGIAAYVGIHI